jgi:hypothetical protein
MKIGRQFFTVSKWTYVFAALLTTSMLLAPSRTAAGEVRLSQGQTIYTPIYSYIHYGNKFKKIDLTATLSVRNTDMTHSIEVIAVDYYSSSGKLIKNHLDTPVQLGPLSSTHYKVAESDLSGGLGASFVVRWQSSTEVSQPVVEGVMIGTISAQGISIVSRGEVIRNRKD